MEIPFFPTAVMGWDRAAPPSCTIQSRMGEYRLTKVSMAFCAHERWPRSGSSLLGGCLISWPWSVWFPPPPPSLPFDWVPLLLVGMLLDKARTVRDESG